MAVKDLAGDISDKITVFVNNYTGFRCRVEILDQNGVTADFVAVVFVKKLLEKT